MLVESVKVGNLLLQRHNEHSATYVNADKVRSNLVLDGHRCADGATFSSMSVWHDSDD